MNTNLAYAPTLEQVYLELNKKTAYFKDTPIVDPSQLDRPIAPLLIDLNKDPEWAERARQNKLWWRSDNFKENADKLDPVMVELHNRLLSFGGTETCFAHPEDDAEKILSRGQFWYGDKTDTKKGRNCKCHQNSCDLWEVNQAKLDISIVTGYALSSDGMWRQHSWLIWLKSRRSRRLIETTERRIAYYGFTMSTDEAWQFVNDNR